MFGTKKITAIVALAAATMVAGCSNDSTSPVVTETVLLDVIPPGGATGVDPAAPIVVTFDHPIGWGMEAYAELHEGDVNGVVVSGTWDLSDDRGTLTFTLDEPLKSAMTYVIHLGGGIMDAQNRYLNWERYGFQLGGEWCTGEQMGPGPGGPMGPQYHQGPGWQHANGMYGMLFTFTTA